MERLTIREMVILCLQWGRGTYTGDDGRSAGAGFRRASRSFSKMTILLPARSPLAAMTALYIIQMKKGVPQSLDIQIGLWQFNNPAGLYREGDSLFSETAASGEPMNEAENENLTKTKR